MFRLFQKYASVGVLNTLLHWSIFYALYWQGITQSVANGLAFLVAVSFSFLINSRYTFQTDMTGARYLLYTGFMGAMAFTLGGFADWVHLPAVITLIVFSGGSLIAGFLYARYVVFRR
ncbi:GtrA family protein [Oceanospirillum sediminis]|uniref:Bactoprenol-linked glucose translocase n=1 Tax=Oceanospirillum sediminis TaxID=2760088 RepID=A0A839ISU0_9GAMM|nr:GtrA family protein [Oceanospirillum sediminis]MBB1488385.1 GtrA family protein [Oceanospirillum sediminis]